MVSQYLAQATCTVNGEIVDCSDVSGMLASAGMTFVLIWLVVMVLIIVSLARIFTKAGQAWWKSLIPIYNTYIYLKVVGRPGWWILLYFIPFVNIVVTIIVTLDLAKSFGKDALVGILTILLPIIMIPVFAFSKSFQYVGPGGSAAPTASGTPPEQSTLPQEPTA